MPNIANLPDADVKDGAAWWSSQGYIDGLQMQWDAVDGITVSSGSAWIPSESKVVHSDTAISKAGLSLTASTWYDLFLYLNAGTPDIEIVTTAPDAPYNGTARSKTGDASRRYVGSLRTESAGNLIRFDQAEDRIDYLMNINTAPLHPLHYGAAEVTTAVSLADAVPVTSKRVGMYLENTSTNGAIAYISVPPLASIADVITFVRPSGRLSSTYVLDATQSFNYAFNGTPSAGFGLDAWVTGYFYTR